MGGRQFVAHANSILETEATTEKMAGLDLGGKDAGPLVSRLDTYYEDPDLVKGKAQLVNFPPEFAAIPCKPLFYDLALYHVAMPSLDAKLDAGGGELKSDHKLRCSSYSSLFEGAWLKTSDHYSLHIIQPDFFLPSTMPE